MSKIIHGIFAYDFFQFSVVNFNYMMSFKNMGEETRINMSLVT